MTNWMPQLSHNGLPRYIAIADAVEADITSLRLKPGDKLPPQRDLAYDLGVTIGTIGRAYALARQRGLVSGEVGRGTYILDVGTPEAPFSGPDEAPPAIFHPFMQESAPNKLRLDTTAAAETGQALVLQRLMNDIFTQQPYEAADYTRRIKPSWREAGCTWLGSDSWMPAPENVVPTLGVHAAMIAVVSAITATGDKIAFENLTYSSIARSVAVMGRRPIPVTIDAFGIEPDSFERVCAQQHPKVLVIIPSLQNPTLAIMPEDRRRKIVEIAHRHNVWIIEDNIYGASLNEPPPCLAELAPDQTFHLGGLSKSVSAGARGGWVACPPNMTNRVFTAHKMMTGGLPYVLAELASRLVLSGEAGELREKVKVETARREALAREIFADQNFNSHPYSPFLWLALPDPWLPGTFKSAAHDRDILIDSADEFRIGQDDVVYHYVRIGFSVPREFDDIRRGFERLSRLMSNGPAAYDSFE